MRRLLVLAGIGGLSIWIGAGMWVVAAQPETGESSTRRLVGTNGSSPGKVDLNRASAQDLVSLPGITVDVADRIIRHRPYRKLDDLVTRRILGKKEFARIREQVVVGRNGR